MADELSPSIDELIRSLEWISIQIRVEPDGFAVETLDRAAGLVAHGKTVKAALLAFQSALLVHAWRTRLEVMRDVLSVSELARTEAAGGE